MKITNTASPLFSGGLSETHASLQRMVPILCHKGIYILLHHTLFWIIHHFHTQVSKTPRHTSWCPKLLSPSLACFMKSGITSLPFSLSLSLRGLTMVLHSQCLQSGWISQLSCSTGLHTYSERERVCVCVDSDKAREGETRFGHLLESCRVS